MKSIMSIVGVILIVLGIVGFFYQHIPYESKENVAEIGPLKMRAVEEKRFVISPILSGASIATGLILLIAGTIRRR